MIRRIPRPFTVEVRSTGRRKHPQPMMLQEEQPRVEWPVDMIGTDPEPAVAPPKAAGRILPALDAAPPVAPEPARRAKRVSDATIDLDETIEPPQDGADAVSEADPAAAPVENETPVLETVEGRVRRSRRPRSAFPRGERWKARLPAAVHGR